MADRPRIFPGLLPNGEDFTDSTYGREELQRKDYQALREIAAAHESEDVNGRMPRKELVETLAGMERVNE